MKIRFLIISLTITCCSFAQSDTLRLSLSEAEKSFLQNNFQLIASQYGIDATQALIRQARLWDNPVLLTDQNLYDGKFFRHTKTAGVQASGQIYLQVQQLIRTAGKIRKLTEVAGANAAISQLQFEQVLHNLRYSLHNDLFQSAQLLSTIQLYELERMQLSRLLSGMKAQYEAGNIAQKDLLRIQALNISVLQEENEYRKQLADIQSELHLLLQTDSRQFVQAELPPPSIPVLPEIDSLLASARQNNPDYLLEKANLQYSRANLRYQEALRSPDLTLGVEYDKANSYTPNYFGLTLALPLPLINRNQGNIASAAYTFKQEQTMVQMKEEKLTSDIRNAIEKLKMNLELQKNIDPGFMAKYEQLMRNAFNAYQQRQMSLIDFIDLFETYKDTQLKFIQHQFNLQKAKEDLNLLAGQELIH